ncbi:MAG: glutamate synthase [Acidobacteriota bacterium]
MNDSRLIIDSRRYLRYDTPLSWRKMEAEGGCGVVGIASSVPIKGKHLFPSLHQMRNRGNGKGGGIAAVGLSAEQLGVSSEVLEEDYLLQIAYLKRSIQDELEEEFLRPSLEIHHAEKICSIEDYNEIEGLEIKPPEVWRYFCRVKKEPLDDFRRRNKMETLNIGKAEDEFIYQNSFQLNRKYYTSLGEKKAFVLSHGRNMMVLKIVGYAEQVIRYYKLEGMEAHLWIGHHRYPTKGRVWHPGGAHPFIGLNEALVHNGDFANYYSICEYLKQRNIYPLFLTDTEVAVLLFDLLNRVYDYPLEYLLEALAPTTERDFEMLPDEKKKIYRMIQAAHIHGSPDGPWFFIIARNDPCAKQFQLLGITDTSMLRPQVFALQEGAAQIGLIASERQAIDATLRSLEQEDERFWSYADMYWNARGGSYTDGGAFLFRIEKNGNGHKLICTDKFGRIIETPKNKTHFRLHNPITLSRDLAPEFTMVPQETAVSSMEKFHDLKRAMPGMSYEEFWSFCYDLMESTRIRKERVPFAIEILTLLMDRIYDTGSKKRSCLLRMLEHTLQRILENIPLMDQAIMERYMRIDWERRGLLMEPKGKDGILIIDAEKFPPEGEDSLARFIVQTFRKGWRNLILINLRGQRFCGSGLGPETHEVCIHVYGNSGDYLASGLDGAQIYVHGSAQDQVGNIMKSGKLVIYGDVGQTFMYGAKGGEIYLLGNAAGRPLINAVGAPRVVINGTCLDYLAESFMAGDPFNGGGFVILNGIRFGERGELIELETPYPGGNLFSLASGGAIYLRDPDRRVGEDQLNGGQFAEMTQRDCALITPFLKENERLFDIPMEELLTVNGRVQSMERIYRKVEPAGMAVLSKYGEDTG